MHLVGCLKATVSNQHDRETGLGLDKVRLALGLGLRLGGLWVSSSYSTSILFPFNNEGNPYKYDRYFVPLIANF